MNLTHCTLTGVDGVDEPVFGSFDTLIALSDEFPVVEWGFLYSPKRQGQLGRYPSVDFLKLAFDTLPHNVRVALHVCGDGVNTLIDGFDDVRNTMTDVDVLVEKVSARGGRIQLNFNQTRKPVSVQRLSKMLYLCPTLKRRTKYGLRTCCNVYIMPFS